jgi:guanylate kinase
MKNSKVKPQLVVLSAPSGSGKTTICNLLVDRYPEYKISISATTRAPRHNEQDGVEYFFLDEDEFNKKIKNNEFIEYEEVFGNFYGTLKSMVKDLLTAGFTVLFDIDVNGALKVKANFPEAILIFTRPPSMKELKRRLRSRKTDDEAEIQKRLHRLPEEYKKSAFFDYDIINEDLDKTIEKIHQIIEEHRKIEKNVPQ